MCRPALAGGDLVTTAARHGFPPPPARGGRSPASPFIPLRVPPCSLPLVSMYKRIAGLSTNPFRSKLTRTSASTNRLKIQQRHSHPMFSIRGRGEPRWCSPLLGRLFSTLGGTHRPTRSSVTDTIAPRPPRLEGDSEHRLNATAFPKSSPMMREPSSAPWKIKR